VRPRGRAAPLVGASPKACSTCCDVELVDLHVERLALRSRRQRAVEEGALHRDGHDVLGVEIVRDGSAHVVVEVATRLRTEVLQRGDLDEDDHALRRAQLDANGDADILRGQALVLLHRGEHLRCEGFVLLAVSVRGAGDQVRLQRRLVSLGEREQWEEEEVPGLVVPAPEDAGVRPTGRTVPGRRRQVLGAAVAAEDEDHLSSS